MVAQPSSNIDGLQLRAPMPQSIPTGFYGYRKSYGSHRLWHGFDVATAIALASRLNGLRVAHLL